MAYVVLRLRIPINLGVELLIRHVRFQYKVKCIKHICGVSSFPKKYFLTIDIFSILLVNGFYAQLFNIFNLSSSLGVR